jgi:hypothetical protein
MKLHRTTIRYRRLHGIPLDAPKHSHAVTLGGEQSLSMEQIMEKIKARRRAKSLFKMRIRRGTKPRPRVICGRIIFKTKVACARYFGLSMREMDTLFKRRKPIGTVMARMDDDRKKHIPFVADFMGDEWIPKTINNGEQDD